MSLRALNHWHIVRPVSARVSDLLALPLISVALVYSIWPIDWPFIGIMFCLNILWVCRWHKENSDLANRVSEIHCYAPGSWSAIDNKSNVFACSIEKVKFAGICVNVLLTYKHTNTKHNIIIWRRTLSEQSWKNLILKLKYEQYYSCCSREEAEL